MNQKERIRKWKSRGIAINDFEEYEVLYNKAKGECEVCGKKLSLENGNSDEPTAHLDHDHRSGKIRGILCSNCNRSIGQLEKYNYKNRYGVAMYLLKGKSDNMILQESTPSKMICKCVMNKNNSPGKGKKEAF